MTYSEPLINQISCFLTSVGFGFVLCILYIALRLIFRIISSGRGATMLCDGVFILLASNLSFFFMIISNSGQVRLNLIIGQAVGGAVMYFALGRYLERYLFHFCDLLHRTILNLLYPLRIYVRALYNGFVNVLHLPKKILSKNDEKSEKWQRKFKNIAKIHLKSKNK